MRAAAVVPVPASAPVDGLEPNKTYHYRIVGSNGAGSIVGADREFTTVTAPPDVGGSAFASAITPRSVRLHGTVNPNNSPASLAYRVRDDAGLWHDREGLAAIRQLPAGPIGC